jgi:hypothetical protein
MGKQVCSSFNILWWTLETTFWEIPEEKLLATIGVDKWALSSCLMWLFGVFGSANLSLSTIISIKTCLRRGVSNRACSP